MRGTRQPEDGATDQDARAEDDREELNRQGHHWAAEPTLLLDFHAGALQLGSSSKVESEFSVTASQKHPN